MPGNLIFKDFAAFFVAVECFFFQHSDYTRRKHKNSIRSNIKSKIEALTI